MELAQVTPLIITFNEEANIARTLAGLDWASRIVVIDSGSTDATLDLLRQNPRVRIHHREFDNFAAQCNFGLSKIETRYTLSLDADHVMPLALLQEIERCAAGEIAAWEIPFTYCVYGEPLRASLLPARVALFRTDAACFENDGHAHHARVQGRVGRMVAALRHDDRKPLARWLSAQVLYAGQEVEKLRGLPLRQLSWPDRCRRLYLAPWLVLPYCLLGKGLILEGRRGLHYVLQRFFYEVLFALSLLDATLQQVVQQGGKRHPP